MMRRLAAAAAAAAVGFAVLATAAPAMAAPPGTGMDDRDYGRHGSHYESGYTRLSFDAGPEPIWYKKRLSLSGKLSVRCDEDYIDGVVAVIRPDHCEDRGWDWLGSRRIEIQFKSDRTGRWDYVGSVRTDHDGYFYTTARAYESGTWRAVYEGGRYLDSSAAYDWVKVIKRY
jgi:hypothetical protein